MIKSETGGIIKITDGVELFIPPGALEKDTTISAVMSLEHNNESKTLVFKFGPPDTICEPSAELRIDKKLFEETDIDEIKLYSEDGEEIEPVLEDNANVLIFYIEPSSYYYYRRR
jgi:hypothetical protein